MNPLRRTERYVRISVVGFEDLYIRRRQYIQNVYGLLAKEIMLQITVLCKICLWIKETIDCIFHILVIPKRRYVKSENYTRKYNVGMRLIDLSKGIKYGFSEP